MHTGLDQQLDDNLDVDDLNNAAAAMEDQSANADLDLDFDKDKQFDNDFQKIPTNTKQQGKKNIDGDGDISEETTVVNENFELNNDRDDELDENTDTNIDRRIVAATWIAGNDLDQKLDLDHDLRGPVMAVFSGVGFFMRVFVVDMVDFVDTFLNMLWEINILTAATAATMAASLKSINHITFLEIARRSIGVCDRGWDSSSKGEKAEGSGDNVCKLHVEDLS
jgi:hypothetical protein